MVRSVVFGTSTLSVLRAGCRLEFLNPKELELSSCTLGCRCLLDRVGAAMISMILGRSAQFGWCLVLGTQSRAEARTSWHERRRMWKTCPLRPPPPPPKIRDSARTPTQNPKPASPNTQFLKSHTHPGPGGVRQPPSRGCRTLASNSCWCGVAVSAGTRNQTPEPNPATRNRSS